MKILHGDSREVLKTLADASIDSCVCDPPYALVSIQKRFSADNAVPAQFGKDGLYARASAGFMGQKWDTGEVAFDPAFWVEVLRVLKPGGHLLAFGGTRSYHRLACAIEDAGFEIRDQIGWLYGSGFPKSHNQKGEWEGWGTALKPAWEPIILARKPLIGTVAENVLQFRTGAINIDECRVETNDNLNGGAYSGGPKDLAAATSYATGVNAGEFVQTTGRWPANVITDGSDEVTAAFPQAPGQIARSSSSSETRKNQNTYGNMRRGTDNVTEPRFDIDKSAARFFYCAKASKADRNEGCGELPPTTTDGRTKAADNAYQRGKTERHNTHPTVKPTALMQYLCRLVTPPNGTVLDPFMGSGSTGKAALREGFDFIGIEREADYYEIALRRIGAEVMAA